MKKLKSGASRTDQNGSLIYCEGVYCNRSMHDYALDKTDIEILRILFNDCRTSCRSIGSSVGLSKNTVKARISRLVSNGVIGGFAASINPAVFGYSWLFHLTIREGKEREGLLSQLGQLGRPMIRMDCIEGFSIFALSARDQDVEKIQSFVRSSGPALVQNCIVGQHPVRHKLRDTDLMILDCLIANPRMEVSEIAKRVSVSSKTTGNRLARMRENGVLDFIVVTDPAKMPGYLRFGMIIRFNTKNYQKSVGQIQKELDRHFVIAFPMIVHEEMASYQIIGRSIFEIDPVLEKVESLEGVQGAEVFIPFRAQIYEDWILREIDGRLKSRLGTSPGPDQM